MKKEDLKIVFLGTPEFAVESLNLLCEQGYNIAAVVTMPDKPAGRGHKMLHSAVKKYALDHGLRLLQPVNLKDPAFISQLEEINADLFIVIAFRMLPQAVWSMPRLGTFNLHASLLPRYRGAAPINWAVINGDTETGVTTFFLKHEIDTGDIISQERIAIDPDDNVGTVHDKLMALGARLTLSTVEGIIAGNLDPIPQERLLNGEEPTPAPKIFKDTCHIDWSLPAESVNNLVRGLSPYPAAWSELTDNGKPAGTMKILKAQVIDRAATGQPGSVIVDGQSLTVNCGSGQLRLLEIQPAGKRPMAADAYLRGAHLTSPALS